MVEPEVAWYKSPLFKNVNVISPAARRIVSFIVVAISLSLLKLVYHLKSKRFDIFEKE
ncbi:hypothetical protein D3C74_421270 [compost metagenome]